MPTTARMIAAILFAALGWFAADLVKPLLLEGKPVGMFSPVAAAFGALVGWFFVGKRIERGLGTGFGIGTTGAALLVFWVLLSFSGNEMLTASMRMSYDGPIEALQDMFNIATGYVILIATPAVIGTLLIGGLGAGWLVEKAALRWE